MRNILKADPFCSPDQETGSILWALTGQQVLADHLALVLPPAELTVRSVCHYCHSKSGPKLLYCPTGEEIQTYWAEIFRLDVHVSRTNNTIPGQGEKWGRTLQCWSETWGPRRAPLSSRLALVKNRLSTSSIPINHSTETTDSWDEMRCVDVRGLLCLIQCWSRF